MLLQVFSEHLLHVLGGGAIVAGLLFGLIGVLVFLDKRGRKSGSKHQPGNQGKRGAKKRLKRKRGVWQ